MVDPEFPPEAYLDSIFDTVSNTGRWGKSDELGTLNHITAEKRVEAAALVRSGRAVSISKAMDTVQAPGNPHPVRHAMTYLAHENAGSALDEFTVSTHGYALTHLDAVAHVYRDGEIYNGRWAREVVTPAGLTFADVYAQRHGIFTRGVLLDVAAALGKRWLDPDEAVGIKDLERAENLTKLRVGRGDAVFVRVGLGAREKVEGPEDTSHRSGIMPEVLLWLAEREVALYSGDCVEKLPSPYERYPIYLHNIGLPSMGLVLLDCPDVEPLAAACREEGRSEFLLSAAPLALPGATGSPINPVCLW